MAHIGKEARYRNWLNILANELDFFGKPKLIAIGGAVEQFLKKHGFQVDYSIMHFSQQNSARFKNYFIANAEKSDSLEVHQTLKSFSREILKSQEYPNDLQNMILARLFNSEITEWHKGMFLYYKDRFSSIDS